MGIKKINKKGASLLVIILMIVAVIMMFIGMWNYFYENMSDAGVSIDSKYGNMNRSISGRFNNVNARVIDIRAGLEAAGTPGLDDTGDVLKGAYSALLIGPTVVTDGLALVNDFTDPLDLVPDWVITMLIAGITAIIVFVVLKAALGRTEI